jgi:ribosome modulation factor
MNQAEIIAAAHRYPDQFWAGLDASNAGVPASACPYGPDKREKMLAWLSGHVTATEDRAAA